MREKIRTKINNNVGETIGETLVALLISALALMMLAGAIGSAANIVTRNKTSMGEYYVGDSANAVVSKQYEVYNRWKGAADTNLP